MRHFAGASGSTCHDTAQATAKTGANFGKDEFICDFPFNIIEKTKLLVKFVCFGLRGCPEEYFALQSRFLFGFGHDFFIDFFQQARHGRKEMRAELFQALG